MPAIFVRHRLFRVSVMALAAVVLLATAGAVMAQGEIDPTTGALPELKLLFMSSPVINSLIAGLSVIAVLLFILQLITISSKNMMPSWLVNELNGLIIQKQYDEATKLCRANKGLLIATIVQRCLEHAGQDHAIILEMLESEGRRRADIVWNRVSYLADVANVAPMLGLLGTVLGMIGAFFVLPSATASVTSRAMSQEIGGAMATTFFGLIVAIVASIFYSFLKGRATRVLAEVEESAHALADRISRSHRGEGSKQEQL